MNESKAAEILRENLLADIDGAIRKLDVDSPGGWLQSLLLRAQEIITELIVENKGLRELEADNEETRRHLNQQTIDAMSPLNRPW